MASLCHDHHKFPAISCKGFNKGLASAVLAASIFHYGNFSIREAKNYLSEKGIPIRL